MKSNTSVGVSVTDSQGEVNACDSTSDSKLEKVRARWLDALRKAAPNLPPPIAAAMVESVSHSPLGEALAEIEDGLIQVERANLDGLTGSEVRVLGAILRETNKVILQLDGEISRLYDAKDK